MTSVFKRAVAAALATIVVLGGLTLGAPAASAEPAVDAAAETAAPRIKPLPPTGVSASVVTHDSFYLSGTPHCSGWGTCSLFWSTREAPWDFSGTWGHDAGYRSLASVPEGSSQTWYVRSEAQSPAGGSGLSWSTAVEVTVTRPKAPTPPPLPSDLVRPATSDTATVRQGEQTDALVTFEAKRAFRDSVHGTLTLTAPAGTTFTPGQTSQRGQYQKAGGGWASFAGDIVTDGRLSNGGTTLTYDLVDRNWDVAKDQAFRFTTRLAAATDATVGTRDLTARVTGSADTGTFDATTTTGVQVTAAPATITAAIPDTVPGARTGWVQASVDRDGVQGRLELVAPEHTTFAAAEGVRSSDGATVTATLSDGGRRAVFPDTTYTWQDDFRRARFDLQVDADAPDRTLLGGGTATVLAPGTTDVRAAGTLQVTTTVRPFAVTSHVDGGTYAPGLVTFRGAGATGATVTAVNQFGFVVGTATVVDGAWSFSRPLGVVDGGYDLTFTQTTTDGTETVVDLHLHAGSVLGLEVTSPADGHYVPGTVTLEGTATQGAGIAVLDGEGRALGQVDETTTGTWQLDLDLDDRQGGQDLTVYAFQGDLLDETTVHLDPAP